ncbi:T9SS type A sorting domain-containing protein [candidate division KSB1 bacterium]|nr:T9SS type A sorting domain-containing protein [candidate division KSB1 bacterium]NIS24978.1 T9SS type A sorting domain-containing protein [candidate division KSB1 bacterium]NIT71899.1 T9SS type A sorting domain-containing protein [candidate division KSB1 bacterium]NIU25633.1 T9SS type A sorting domain-containing protein [candidate division KSB1 bacterium]NIU93246.1 T9SS type A sorting domain-containing protein [candidate division KSB1 bacterium]
MVDIDSDGDLDLFVGDVKGGLHFFRNSVIATNVESPVSGEHPRTFRLNQNYPNPFNATTAIRYALPVAGKVTLEIFDVLGREVFTLEDEAIKAAGFHETVADFSGLGSGVYFYRIRVEGEQRFQATKKLLFVK